MAATPQRLWQAIEAGRRRRTRTRRSTLIDAAYPMSADGPTAASCIPTKHLRIRHARKAQADVVSTTRRPNRRGDTGLTADRSFYRYASCIERPGELRRCPSHLGPWIAASKLHALGNPGILWRPSVYGAAVRTLGECHSFGQLIDVRQIDINARGDQFLCSRALEHQLRQRDLQQSLATMLNPDWHLRPQPPPPSDCHERNKGAGSFGISVKGTLRVPTNHQSGNCVRIAATAHRAKRV